MAALQELRSADVVSQEETANEQARSSMGAPTACPIAAVVRGCGLPSSCAVAVGTACLR